MGPCVINVFLSTTNKIQRYTIFFIVVSAVRVSSGFSAHHQELKSCTCHIGYLSNLFAATANLTSIQWGMYSFWAPDDEQKTHSKHVEHWQQWRLLHNVASCWLCIRMT